MRKHSHWKRGLALLLAAALLTAAAPGALAWTRQGEYRERFALATDGARWGYVNGAGSLVIPLRYTQAEPFFLGIAKVGVNGKYGILSQDGSYLLTPIYDALEDVGWGLYAAKRSGAWSLLSLSELPAGSRLPGADPRALYTGASSIAWEERDVIVTQPPIPEGSLPEAGPDGTLGEEAEPGPAPEPSAQPSAEPSAQPGAGEEPETDGEEAAEALEEAPIVEHRRELVLRWANGETLHFEEDALLRLLREREVPGWAFPTDRARSFAFTDVSGRDWFSPWVDIVYSVGLMEGRGGTGFQPWEKLKICEAVKLVALMDSHGAGRASPGLVGGRMWYAQYLEYCVEYGVVAAGEFDDYERPITRAELALLISRTSLYAASGDINDPEVIRRSIPDVKPGDYAAEAIFGLYAKGVLTGYSNALNFQPNAPIVRAEVAAMVARMVRPEQRVTLQLGTAGMARSISLEEPED